MRSGERRAPRAQRSARPAPLVSVIIPAYNHARFIEAAIRSVFAQVYRPLELVVVDDGSRDDTLARARALRADSPFARYEVIGQLNQGTDIALMRGIGAARGEVLALLNSDDLFEPNRLEHLVPEVDAESGIVLSGVRFIDAEGNALAADHDWPRWYENALTEAERCPTLGHALLLHNISVTSGNFVFHRRLYERLGGFAPYRFAHDWDFLLRSVYFAEPRRVPEKLLAYRVHDANTSESVRDLLADECSGVLRRYLALFAQGPSPNLLAPGPVNWPAWFPRFAATRSPAFATVPLAAVIAGLRSPTSS
jgi:glycosyltransferase involved in cell wall biosynthesis